MCARSRHNPCLHGTLSCPVCGTTGIVLGATACPHCAVGFASPVVTPTLQQPLAPARTNATATAVATATAPAPADTWSPPMYMPAPATTTAAPITGTVAYGSIWRRMLAALIDGVIVGIPFMLVLGPSEYFRWEESGVSFVVWTRPWEYLEMLVFLVYAAAMQSSSKQATLGMQALDLRLVHDEGHGPVSFARAAARDLLTYLSALILLIGYRMIAFTDKRQALHDKLTGTVVLHDASH